MATAYSNEVDKWRVKVDASISSQTDTTATIACKVYWCSIANGFDTAANGYGTVGGVSGSTTYFNAYSAYGETRETLVTTYSRTVDKGDSAYTVSCSATVSLTGGYRDGKGTASVNVTVPAIAYETPNPPTGCTATRTGDKTATVSWSNGTTTTLKNRTAVIIERRTDSGSYTQLASLGASVTSYSDSGIAADHTYTYRVKSRGKGGDSSYSTSSAIPLAYQAPNPPTGCSAARNSDSKATVTWTNGATTTLKTRTAVLIERSVDGGTWTQLSSLGASVTNYTDNSISANHRYAYRVRSKGDGGYSGYATSGYIYTTPAAPKAVNLDKTAATTISVDATVNAPYATGYDVQRSTDSGSTWSANISTNAALPVTDTVAGTVRYRVRSNRSNSLYSAWKQSSDITTIVAPNAPTIAAKPASVTASGTECTVRWTPNHPDGTSQTAAQVLVTAPDSTQTTVDIGGATNSYTFTPDSVGIWTAQVRTHGLAASWGAWSQTVEWRMADRPTVSITSPATDGTEIDDLPLVISWEVTDVSGVSSQKVTVALDGDAVYTRTPATSVRSLQVTRYDAAFEDGEAYTISIRVVNGYGLDTTAVRTFAIGWDLPSVPDMTVEEGEGASASITVGTGPGSTVPTESITVQRVAPDGSAWTVATGLQDGDTVSDPLAPLGVDVTYRAIAYASSGASSASEAVANIRSSGWVLGFGDAAGEWLVLVGNPDASYSLEQGGELFHFADGGAGGGLPVWYGTTDRDEGGSLSFDTVGQHDSDRLRELARKWPVGWLRDPFGHRWRARILPSVKHGLGELWTVGIDWTAVRWREAWDG